MEELKDNSFAQECANLTALHERKNHDYGNTFGDLFQRNMRHPDNGMRDAMTYALGHLQEKVTRIETTLYNGNQVKGESFEDSLMDLASYAVMTLTELHRHPGK